MDAKIPPIAGELSLRFKLRPAVRVLAGIQLFHYVGGELSLFVHSGQHLGGGEQFKVLLGTEVGILDSIKNRNSNFMMPFYLATKDLYRNLKLL